MIFSIAACNNTPPNTFKLEGFAEGVKDSENITLYYSSLQNGEWYEIADTTKIINGKFLFEGNIDELTAAELVLDGFDVVISARLYLEPTTMKLRINKNEPYAYKLTETKVEKESIELRKELESYEKIFHEDLLSIDDIQSKMFLNNNNISIQDSLENNYSQIAEELKLTTQKMNKIRLDFILRHNSYQIVPNLLYLIRNTISVDTLKNIYDNLPKRSKTSLLGKFAIKQIENLESEKNTTKDIEEDTLIGKSAPDFTRKDFSGKTIRLSDYKNKNFILLDFWASWCIPCIREIPKIKDLHSKYSEKGLEIISISADEDNDSWLNAINKYQLGAWPQILSVEDKNNSVFNKDDISFMYNVESIPHFIFIDKQGKIIAKWSYLGKEQLSEIELNIKTVAK